MIHATLLVIALLVAIAGFRAALCLRQFRYLSATPDTGYARALVVSKLLQVVLQAMLAVVFVVALFSTSMIGMFHEPWQALSLLVGMALLQQGVDLVVSAVKSFWIDARFGFNRLTVTHFVREGALSLVLRAGIAAALAYLAMALVNAVGSSWWLPFVVLTALPVYLGGILNQRLLRPRLERQSRLPAGALAERLQACLRRCGFVSARLVVAEGSSRSSQVNAHAEQAGRFTRVILLDTLLQNLPAEHIEAVVAHELGHLAGHHLQWRFALTALIWLITLGATSMVARHGVPLLPAWQQLGMVLALAPSVRFLMQPLLLHSSRRWEYQADAFAAAHGYAVALCETLPLLFRLNASASTSDRWFAAFHDSHPQLQKRLQRLSPM